MSKIFRYTWPPLIVAIVIFYLCCLIPGNDVPNVGFQHADKIVHFLMYLGLAGVSMINYIWLKKGHVIVLKLIVLAIGIPILYGGLIEIVQAYCFEGRSGDWLDFLADALGAFAALPFALCFRRFLLRRQLL